MPLGEITGGAKQPPRFVFLKVVQKRYWGTKHAYIVLGCIGYVFKRGVDASKADLLIVALVVICLSDGTNNRLTSLEEK